MHEQNLLFTRSHTHTHTHARTEPESVHSHTHTHTHTHTHMHEQSRNLFTHTHTHTHTVSHRCLHRAHVSSRVLDVESLCLVRGRLCWMVYIDALVLNYEGNLMDAVVMASWAALRATRCACYCCHWGTNRPVKYASSMRREFLTGGVQNFPPYFITKNAVYKLSGHPNQRRRDETHWASVG